jgi:cell division protein FtsL
VHPAVLVAAFTLFFAAGSYLYALNRGAVQGFETQKLEREIGTLENENGKLRISEAELRSLSRIEEVSKNREMVVPEQPVLLVDHGVVALR